MDFMFKKIMICLLFCFSIVQAFTQEIEQNKDQNGRYQLQVIHPKHGTQQIFMLDTQTSVLWQWEYSGWKQFPPLPSTFSNFPKVVK